MCSSVLLRFIFWHPLNSVTGWFFDYMEFNMDIAMLPFSQLPWFSTTEDIRFSFFQVNIMELDASAHFFWWHLLVLTIFLSTIFLAMPFICASGFLMCFNLPTVCFIIPQYCGSLAGVWTRSFPSRAFELLQGSEWEMKWRAQCHSERLK